MKPLHISVKIQSVQGNRQKNIWGGFRYGEVALNLGHIFVKLYSFITVEHLFGVGVWTHKPPLNAPLNAWHLAICFLTLQPVLSNKKGDGHDRPGSVRSQVSNQAGGSKGKPGKTGKKVGTNDCQLPSSLCLLFSHVLLCYIISMHTLSVLLYRFKALVVHEILFYSLLLK